MISLCSVASTASMLSVLSVLPSLVTIISHVFFPRFSTLTHSLTTFAPLFLLPPSEWPGIIRTNNLIPIHRDAPTPTTMPTPVTQGARA